jgi:hypothetical protein
VAAGGTVSGVVFKRRLFKLDSGRAPGGNFGLHLGDAMRCQACVQCIQYCPILTQKKSGNNAGVLTVKEDRNPVVPSWVPLIRKELRRPPDGHGGIDSDPPVTNGDHPLYRCGHRLRPKFTPITSFVSSRRGLGTRSEEDFVADVASGMQIAQKIENWNQ